MTENGSAETSRMNLKNRLFNYTKLESQGLKLLNSLIEQTLIVFGIERSLSKKAVYIKTIKTEFI